MPIINKRIDLRHMEQDPVLKDYILNHLHKIENFLQYEQIPIDIDFTIVPSKTREHHKVEVRVKSTHYDLIAEIEKNGVDIYDAINIVVAEMLEHLRKNKARKIDDRNHGKPSPSVKK